MESGDSEELFDREVQMSLNDAGVLDDGKLVSLIFIVPNDICFPFTRVQFTHIIQYNLFFLRSVVRNKFYF